MASLDYLLDPPDTCDWVQAPPWPLLIFLHGSGERQNGLREVRKHGPPKLREERKTHPFNGSFPFVLISPKCSEDKMWHYPDMLDKLEKLLDKVKAVTQIDPTRIYLTGWSMGGFGAMSLALRCPEQFAALAVVSTGCYELQKISEKDDEKKKQILAPIKSLPIRVYFAANDQVAFAAKYTIPLITDLQRHCVGFEHVSPFAKDPDEEAHVMACERAYRNNELYRWFLKFKNE